MPPLTTTLMPNIVTATPTATARTAQQWRRGFAGRNGRVQFLDSAGNVGATDCNYRVTTTQEASHGI